MRFGREPMARGALLEEQMGRSSIAGPLAIEADAGELAGEDKASDQAPQKPASESSSKPSIQPLGDAGLGDDPPALTSARRTGW